MSFDLSISKEQAEKLLVLSKSKRLPFEIMCKEYLDDGDWVGLNYFDLDDNNKLDDSLKTFQLWI